MRRLHCFSFVFSFAVLLFTVFANAQTATTSLRGTVADENGAVIPGATVTLSNPDTGFARTGTTNGTGAYQFLQLPPGTYILQIASTGFATSKQGIELLVDSPTTLNVTLHVGKTETVVEVTGEAPLINVQDATIGNAFNTQQIASLPFEGRDPVGMLSLQAGVAFVGDYKVDDREDSRNGAVAGARSDQSNITLNGLDNNTVGGNAFHGALRTTLDAVQEFRVTTTAANADAGRSSGAQVSIVEKSGTNTLHGSAYELHRPTFVANDWFTKNSQLQSGLSNRPPKFVRNTFGASVGGAVVKNRMFFFLNYEGMRRRESQPVTRLVPSEDLRNGYLSYSSCGPEAATDCSPSDPGVSVVRLTPTQIMAMDPLGTGPSAQIMSLLKQYPMPNNDTVGDGLNFRGYTFTSPLPTNQNTYIAKLDINLTQDGKHRLFVRGGLQGDREAGLSQWVYPDGSASAPSSLSHWNNKGIQVGYTAALSANLINNFRYALIRPGFSSSGAARGHYVSLRGLDDIDPITRTQSEIIPVHNLANDVTWARGKHTLAFGGNILFVSDKSSNDLNSWFSATTNPSWLFNGGIANTGQGLDPAVAGLAGVYPVADFFSNSFNWPMGTLVGIVAQIDSRYNRDKTGTALPEGTFLNRNYKRWELEGYGQDSWKVTPNLTLTFGLRYTLLQPPYEANGIQVQPTVDMHQWYMDRYTNMLQGVSFKDPIEFDLSGQANGRKPYWHWDKLDFAPRFAFAYSPSFEDDWLKALFGGIGKSSIRGGYGMYYDHFGQGVVSALNRYSSFGLSARITNPANVLTTETAPRFTGLHDIPASMISPAPAGTFPVVYPDSFAITSGLDDHLKTPYAHVFNLSISRELSRNTSLEIGYIGRLGKRLLQQDDMAMPLNLVDPRSKTTYFQAAQMLAKMVAQGVDIHNVSPIPYWENMFPGAAGLASNMTLGCAVGNVGTGSVTATQALYDLFACVPHNETGALQVMDLPGIINSDTCFPSCSINGPYSYFDPQFSSLYSWRSIGVSSYHAMLVTLRRRMTSGLQFDFNYTFSKSIDVGSDAERIIAFDEWGGPGGQIQNSWDPRGNMGLSDFDARHQINANWTYELPVGKGKTWGGAFHGVSNALLGGWALSGVTRWANGYPYSISNGANWATNWQLGGNAVYVGPNPNTGSYLLETGPNMFKDRTAAMASWRYAMPGERGSRNPLTGPGYFSLDSAISKNFKVNERVNMKFTWQVFNVFNSVSFDGGTYSVPSSLDSSETFGNYNQTLTKYRTMEFGLRLDF